MPVPEAPFERTNFVVDFGAGEIGFTEVSGLGSSAAIVEYREGSDKTLGLQKLPGLIKHGDVVLKRGVDGNDALWLWWKKTEDGAFERRDVLITLLDEARSPVMRWKLHRAWPSAYEVAPLIAAASGVVIESLTLTHEGFEAEAT
jgi:phage tail-like protein